MLATAVVAAGPSSPAVDIDAALAAAKVVHGVDADAVAALARQALDPSFTGRSVVARGEPAEAGKDGSLDDSPPYGQLPGEVRADGSIDYRERHFLVPVAEGMGLGRLVPPTAGAPGRNVHGQPVAAKPGRALPLRIGPGVRLVDGRLSATRSGVLLRDPRQIDVVPLYAHSGDVDYTSGSLHSEGAIEVGGDVREGFAVAAHGDVHVHGALLDGTVTAGGSVRIEQGVLGAAASVTAGGDAWCRHATGATFACDGGVVFADQAAHCRIRAGTVAARTGRGAILGGEVRARRSIVVLVAGTAAGAATRFAVGDVLDVAASRVAATNVEHKVAERARQRLAGSGPERGKALRSGLRAADARLQDDLQLRLRQRELLAGAFVEVHDTLHAGVRVSFGDRTWTTDLPRQRLRLSWSDATDSVLEEELR